MYTRYETHQLTPAEQALFGMETVVALMDPDLNGVVINHPDNGLLAGDRLRSRINPYFDPNRPRGIDNRPYTYAFTDDHNAEQSIYLTERNQRQEIGQVGRDIGIIATLSAQLPAFAGADETTKRRYYHALEIVIGEHDHVRNPDKKAAVEELEIALESLKNRGIDATPRARSAALKAASRLAERDADVYGKLRVSGERRQALDDELKSDTIVKDRLRDIAENSQSIAESPEEFLYYARQRLTKPGNLTVNNAWHHREEPDSWQQLVLAQNGWERLFGSLMRPMSKLAGEIKRELRSKQDEMIALYTADLLHLEDLIDLSMIGDDYTELGKSLQGILFEAEELLLGEKAAEAIEAAKRYRFMLRYRTLPGKPVPPQWYGGLPGIRTAPLPVEPSQYDADPFSRTLFER